MPVPPVPALTLTRSRLCALLGAAQGKRVAVIGDAMLDIYLHGDVERISPEAPVPVVRVHERRLALGGAANVAQNVVALGAASTLVSAVGRDASGTLLREMLSAVADDGAGLIDVSRSTTTKTRVVARVQQVVRVDEEDDADLSPPDVQRLMATAREVIERSDALILEDYNKGVLVPAIIEDAIARAQRHGIPVIVDPKFRNFFSYHGATVFKPNRRELEAALGAAVVLEDPDALPVTLHRLGVANLLLTLGEQGMVLVSGDGGSHRVPTTARAVYDVVGAGDTVTAYLAAMLAAGATAREAAEIANVAAGVEVAKLGAATVSTDEVIDAFDEYRERSAAAGPEAL
ncbi:MAG TPA: bifunctional ADP-heptose synthase [Gemmatimonadaceae bacterium]|nr:bifunctional ADP-heptose synthase [Gemmatimonadaceae bacterium]